MSRYNIRFAFSSTIVILFFVSFLFLMVGCATVPKESVELSYAIGQDLEELHKSYKLLIERYFESLRREVNQKIDTVFIPAYINEYVKTGNLIQHAQAQRADLVEAWARLAVKEVDQERRTRLSPINEAEKNLLEIVNESFGRAIRANATITAHLNSIREVTEVQDEVLKALKIKDLRDKINDALAKASETAADISKIIDKAASERKK